MIENDFEAAMTSEELLAGETRHASEEQSRRVALAVGLTKSSSELKKAWEKDPDLYMVTLKGAIAAYDENKNLEELLVGAMARLVSVVDQDDDVIDRAVKIVLANECAQS